MTNKQNRRCAINYLNELKASTRGYSVEWLDMAIKALERETILDKIKAEIIELRSKQNVGVLECLDIIDKYITELNPSYNSVKTELEPCEDCISRQATIEAIQGRK